MRWEIAWDDSAAREFDALPHPAQESILTALAHLAMENRGDVKRLKGPFAGTYRLRVREYRVRFRLDRGEGKIVIAYAGRRGSAYMD